MVAIQDSQAQCSCNVVTGAEGFLSTVFDLCDECVYAAYMQIYEGNNDLLRTWVEVAKESRIFVPFPRELADRLDALAIKHRKPLLDFG